MKALDLTSPEILPFKQKNGVSCIDGAQKGVIDSGCRLWRCPGSVMTSHLGGLELSLCSVLDKAGTEVLCLPLGGCARG